MKDPQPQRVQIGGHYAGPVTRLGAVAVDFGIILAAFAAVGAIVRWLISVFWKVEITPDRSEVGWWLLALAVWAFLYLWIGLGVAGRTPGKGLAGLRVVGKNGAPLTSGEPLSAYWCIPCRSLWLGSDSWAPSSAGTGAASTMSSPAPA